MSRDLDECHQVSLFIFSVDLQAEGQGLVVGHASLQRERDSDFIKAQRMTLQEKDCLLSVSTCEI